jgi:hypothetical protein
MRRMEALALTLFIRVTCGALNSTVPARSRPAQNLFRRLPCTLTIHYVSIGSASGSHRISRRVRGRVRRFFHSSTRSTTLGNISARLECCRRGERSVYVCDRN